MASIALSIDINKSNNVGTNTSKQPAVADAGAGVFTPTALTGPLSLGLAVRRAACACACAACIYLTVYLTPCTLREIRIQPAADQRQHIILNDQHDLVILRQLNFRQTARRNGIS